jgi:hypothetical protein
VGENFSAAVPPVVYSIVANDIVSLCCDGRMPWSMPNVKQQ